MAKRGAAPSRLASRWSRSSKLPSPTPFRSAITAWENRWSQRNLVDIDPDGVSERAKGVLAKAEAMSLTDYRAALVEREAAQLSHARIAPLADAAITLACPGPAPLWSNAASDPRPTGDPVFNYPSSMLFAPAVTVPSWASAACRSACS